MALLLRKGNSELKSFRILAVRHEKNEPFGADRGLHVIQPVVYRHCDLQQRLDAMQPDIREASSRVLWPMIAQPVKLAYSKLHRKFQKLQLLRAMSQRSLCAAESNYKYDLFHGYFCLLYLLYLCDQLLGLEAKRMSTLLARLT